MNFRLLLSGIFFCGTGLRKIESENFESLGFFRAEGQKLFKYHHRKPRNPSSRSHQVAKILTDTLREATTLYEVSKMEYVEGHLVLLRISILGASLKLLSWSKFEMNFGPTFFLSGIPERECPTVRVFRSKESLIALIEFFLQDSMKLSDF